jgi:hypothetical protein
MSQPVSIQSLLREMADRSVLAKFPSPYYESLQASSYNRASVSRDAAGWFADSDGTGFIRVENNGGKQEWVVMEHEGPGAITKIWAPYFYYGGLDDLEGPEINIYLDGKTEPVIRENFFKLIQGRGSVPPPFASRTARAGNCYLPIPFAKSCKITFNKKPFYNIINYRSYVKGTIVETFTKEQMIACFPLMNEVKQSLFSSYTSAATSKKTKAIISPGKELFLDVRQAGAIHQMEIWLNPQQVEQHPQLLRSLILIAEFDGRQTVWAPLGDFFGSANEINPFQTWTRTVNAIGQMICTWVMPFKTSAKISLKNLSKIPVDINHFGIKYQNWRWDNRSMYFHANWRSDDLVQGSTFSDWNFIDITGKGVVVGDSWTVLNPDYGWWGEGDEKIYVDDAWDEKFPTHFGTGTEDYYGWAGGENPSKDDLFSHPYLANIEVGSATKRRRDVRGFNICTRVRALDAIPFNKRLVFDMEASAGVDIRNPWDYLGYSAVVFWYGMPGAVSNRPPLPEQASKPIITLKEIDELAVAIKKEENGIPGAIEVQALKSVFSSDKIKKMEESPAQGANVKYWNRGNHLLVVSDVPGESITFIVSEQFKPADIRLQLTKSPSFAVVQFYVNGVKAAEPIDLSGASNLTTTLVNLGRHRPVNNEMQIRMEFLRKAKQIDGKLMAAVDYLKIISE